MEVSARRISCSWLAPSQMDVVPSQAALGPGLPFPGQGGQILRFVLHRFFRHRLEPVPQQVPVDFFRHLAQFRPFEIIEQAHFHRAAPAQGFQQPELDRVQLVEFTEEALLPGHGAPLLQHLRRPGVGLGQIFQFLTADQGAVHQVQFGQVHVFVPECPFPVPVHQDPLIGIRVQAVPGKFVEQPQQAVPESVLPHQGGKIRQLVFQFLQGVFQNFFLGGTGDPAELPFRPVPPEDLPGQGVHDHRPDGAGFPDFLQKIPVGHHKQCRTVRQGPGLFQEPVPHGFPQLEAVQDVEHGCSFR